MVNKLLPLKKRVQFLHWQTAHHGRPDFINQLAGYFFFMMHDRIPHTCICKECGISHAEEWSYVDFNTAFIFQLLADGAMKHTQEAIGDGWITPLSGTYFPLGGDGRYPYVQRTQTAMRVEQMNRAEFTIGIYDKEEALIQKLQQEVLEDRKKQLLLNIEKLAGGKFSEKTFVLPPKQSSEQRTITKEFDAEEYGFTSGQFIYTPDKALVMCVGLEVSPESPELLFITEYADDTNLWKGYRRADYERLGFTLVP